MTERLNRDRHFKILGFLVFAICFVVAVYWPGLSGGFLFDDFHSIVLNDAVMIESLSWDALSKSLVSGFGIGVFGRPISMLSFGLNHYLTGLDPFYFKLTNLVIHVLNAVGFFFLIRTFLRHSKGFQVATQNLDKVAFIVALLWAVHPINVSSVLYVVQRMALFSAFFTIYGLLFYCYFRLQRHLTIAKIVIVLMGLAGCQLAAVLSKENGALFPIFVLAIEIFLFGFRFENLQQKQLVYTFLSVFILVPVAIALVYFLTYSMPEDIFSAYGWRGFTMQERLLTESRVLFSYLQWIIFPHVQGMTFFHDGYALSKGLFEPLTTLLSVLALIVLLLVSYLFRNKLNLVCFGIVWFLVAHLMESSIFPLELVFEHRNYLASIGVLIATVILLAKLFICIDRIKLGKTFVLIVVIFFSVTTATRASLWGNQFTFLSSEVKYNPSSSRANLELARWYLSYSDMNDEENYLTVVKLLEKATEAQGNYIDGLAGLLLIHSERNVDAEKIAAWGEEVVRRVQLPKFNGNNPKVLASLIQCAVSKPETCKIDNDLIEKIYNAALSNEKISRKVKGILLSSYSRYFFIVKDEWDRGIQMMKEAIRMSSDETEFKLQLVDMYLFMNNIEEARSRLAVIESNDRVGRYAIQIEKLKINMATVIAANANGEMKLKK